MRPLRAKIDDAVVALLAPPDGPANHDSMAPLPLASELATGAYRADPVAGPVTSVAAYTVTSANLDRLAALLLQGKRQLALQYALDHRLWAHAFIISTRLGPEGWKDVVQEFTQSELAPQFDPSGHSLPDGRQALRVAYSLFAGAGAESSKSRT